MARGQEREIAEAFLAARRRNWGRGSQIQGEMAAMEKLLRLADETFPPSKPRHDKVYWTGSKLVRWDTHTKEYQDL